MTSPFPRIFEGGSTYVVDGLAAALAQTGQSSIPVWMPNTAYPAQYLVVAPTGEIVSRNTAGTSGSSYAAETASWTVVNGNGSGSGSGTDATARAAAAAAQSTANAAVPKLAAPIAKTSAFTAAAAVPYLVDISGGSVVATLPVASAAGAGAEAVFKVSAGAATPGANALSITPAGSDTINGAATALPLRLVDQGKILVSDGVSNWIPLVGDNSLTALSAYFSGIFAPFASSRRRVAITRTFAVTTGSTKTASAQTTFRTPFKVDVAARNIQGKITNFYTDTTTAQYFDHAGAQSLVISSMAIEVASTGVIYPVYFQGQASVTIPGGAAVWHDPLTIETAVGDILYYRTTIASGQVYYPNYQIYAAPASGGYGGVSTNASVTAYTGTISDTASGTLQAHIAPSTITGEPITAKARAFAASGDSIGNGTFDGPGGGWQSRNASGNSVYDTGQFIGRALAGKAGLVNFALPGSDVQGFIQPAGHFLRSGDLQYVDSVIDDYGHNDLAHSRTVAQVQADSITQWGIYYGKTLWATTVTPSTTTTDNWATTGNQTKSSYEANRVAFNQWFRDGAPILAGAAVATGSSTAGTLRCDVYNSSGVKTGSGTGGHPLTGGVIDTSTCIETAQDSGYWKAPVNSRTVTDAAVTGGTSGYALTTLTSNTAAFTSADVGRTVFVVGAGTSGAVLAAVIRSVTSATSVQIALDSGVTATTVSGASCIIGDTYTRDGTHPDSYASIIMAAAVTAATGVS